ncbi:hypothetical protein BRARA_B01952 [Brassica rapa]|uniref:Uncharacterized protein n=1 Tax=Brassica campestris TaxID=3711 RepID=A0A398AHW8_BRACM|nr:hypothetical protein BRARA_B01952 [Brassica rapa]
MHFQTAVLALKPLPNPICHTLSPFFILPFASRYCNSYHSEDEDVFPYRCNVDLDASTSSLSSFRCFSTPSIIALPPACIQKCSKAFLKLGVYTSFCIPHFLLMNETMYLSCSV